MMKTPSNGVLGSSKSSTGTRPPHHSAARTDLVLLIRRTVRPGGYASGFDSPAALLYSVLIILRDSVLKRSPTSFSVACLSAALPGTRHIPMCQGLASDKEDRFEHPYPGVVPVILLSEGC